MKENFYVKEVGYADAISGVIDDQHLQINGMKEMNYTMILMKTNGNLERSGNERKLRVNREAVRFKYIEII